MNKKTRTREDLVREVASLHEKLKQLEIIDEQRERAEQALREAEQRIRALTDISLQGLVIVQGIPLRVVFASAPVAEIIGFSSDELLSFSPDQIQKIMYGDDQPTFWHNYQGRLEGKSVPPRYEARITRKDGKVRWLEVFAGRVVYEGKPAVQAAFVDITERKLTEEALRRNESRYRKIFDNVQDIFYQTDIEGVITDISPSVERYSSYTPEELIGKKRSWRFTQIRTSGRNFSRSSRKKVRLPIMRSS